MRLVRIGWGAALLAMPVPLCRLLTGTALEPRPALLARALGARTILQELLIHRRRTRRGTIAGATVDSLHAASMAGLALTHSRYSRPAAISAAVSGAAAIDSLRSLPPRRQTVGCQVHCTDAAEDPSLSGRSATRCL